MRLNREHTAALDDERQRILAAGGTVQWRVDSWRVSLLLPAAACLLVVVGSRASLQVSALVHLC